MVALDKEDDFPATREIPLVEAPVTLLGKRWNRERDQEREDLNGTYNCCFHVPYFPFLGFSLQENTKEMQLSDAPNPPLFFAVGVGRSGSGTYRPKKTRRRSATLSQSAGAVLTSEKQPPINPRRGSLGPPFQLIRMPKRIRFPPR
jgi:hypothetical protein